MIQGSVEEFAASDKGKKFLGWGWDGVSTVEVDGEIHPADENGVQMYDSPTAFLDSLLSGSGISSFFSGQPEARNTEIVVKGAPPIAAGTTDNTDTIEENINKQSSEVAPVPYGSQPGGNYEIKKGDTLWDIAQKEGITVDDLMRMNNQIQDPARIMAGGMLNVPVNEPDNFDAMESAPLTANVPEQSITPKQLSDDLWRWDYDQGAAQADQRDKIPLSSPSQAAVTNAPATATTVNSGQAVPVTSSANTANNATQSAAPQSGTSAAPSVASNTVNNAASMNPYPNFLMNTAQKAGNAIMDVLNTRRKPTYVAPHMEPGYQSPYQKRQRQQAVYDFE